MEQRIIYLTDWLPLTIVHSEWPVMTVACDYSSGGEFTMRVREHRDGRMIVYATHGSHITGEMYAAAGELIGADSDVAAAVRRVGLSCRAPAGLVCAAISQLSLDMLAA